MSRAAGHRVRLAAVAALLAAPTVLAFFSGGFFDQPRLWAALGALLLLVAVALTITPPLPRSGPGRAALLGLGLLTLLTGLSTLWAPIAADALDDAQRVLLYLAVTVAAAALLRPRPLARAVEPALALGGTIVISYGLSARLLPSVIELSPDVLSAGRLAQPLTYWNAMGALAALALSACACMAGDPSRARWVRLASASASAPLGLGIYLSFSRGALAAVAVGIGILMLLAPTWPQLRGLGVCAATGAAAAAGAGRLPGLHRIQGPLHPREVDGAEMLALLVLLVVAAAAVQALLVAGERSGRLPLARLPVPNFAIALGGLAAVAAAGVAFVVVSGERPPPVKGPSAARLSSVESNRYAYWEVAVGSFAEHPVIGVGASGFRLEWLRKREMPEAVHDAHSLYIETGAELGLAGVVALALFLGGVAACALSVHRCDPPASVGPTAIVGVWAAACALDWHWEMPAVTLPALLAAAALIARADVRLPARPPEPAREPRVEAPLASVAVRPPSPLGF